MRVDVVSKEYPPEVYGGAGVHVAELVRALRAIDGLETRVHAFGKPRDEPLTALDATLGGALGRLLDRRDFRAGRDETLHLAGAISGPARVLLVGLGKGSERASALRRVGALAARQAGRHFTGFELNPAYCDIIRERLAAPEVPVAGKVSKKRKAAAKSSPLNEETA